MPILQHVALCNKHINHPAMGPYMMLDIEPHDAGGVEATKEAFHNAVARGESHMADHCILGLWDKIPAVEVLDLLLSVAIPKNVLDDHYFVFPGYTWRGIEWLGQEYLPILMRPVARYTARYPRTPEIPEIEALSINTNS